jgi:hypothetical protein
MASVLSNKWIDDNDYEKIIPLVQTGAGVTPLKRLVDDGDIERLIIQLETTAGVSPVHKNIDRKDWTAALIGVQIKLNSRTATVTIASPAVVSLATHGFTANTAIKFASTGALPTGLTVGPTYYVSATGLAAGTFQVSGSAGGASINTTGTQSGVHTVYPVA